MTLDIVISPAKDAPEMATVHLAAMDDNMLMHAKFHDDECRRRLRDSVEKKKALDHLNHEIKGVLVALDLEAGEIARFVKWIVQQQPQPRQEPKDSHQELPLT